MAGDEKAKEWLKILLMKIVVVIVLGLLIFFGGCALWKTAGIQESSKGLYSAAKDSAGFLGEEFSKTRGILTGEESLFDWEGKVEKKKITGIEIKKLSRLSGKEIGVIANIVWEFGDEDFEDVEVFLGCKLYSDRFNDTVDGTIKSTNIGAGGNSFIIDKDSKKGEIFVDCIFEDIEEVTPGEERTAKFGLDYSFSPSVNLKVFISPSYIYKESYRRGGGLEDLEEGIHSDSTLKTEYKDDIGVDIYFAYQPLFVGQDNTFYFRINNNGNKVELKDLNVSLPGGVGFVEGEEIEESCELQEEDFKSINKGLNSDGEYRFSCDVSVGEDAFRSSSQVSAKNAIVDFEYTVKKEESLNLKLE